MRRSCFLAIVLILLRMASSAQDQSRGITDRDGLGILVLPDGSRFKTTLYHLNVIGILARGPKLLCLH
jgi:hypothetical protein